MTDETAPAPPTPENSPNAGPSLLQVLTQVWRSLNERKMVQWTIAYVALAYSLQHGVQLTSEAFKWEGVTGISMLLLALGLPVVVTVAWYHGERGSQRISGPELTIISILLVVGSLLFFVFVRPLEQLQPPRGPATEAGAISIAVLPFGNLSDDREQEFFSDGMTVEIISALAKVPSLQVVARTSVFQFKGEKKDMRAIGQALGARFLIDGSVRKAGNRVRITAQLVQADNGVGVWTDSYDREMTDVFAIQEEIATAIAVSLRVPLGLKQGERLVSNRSIDPESYQQYLRARALYRARAIDQAIALLEPAVARDPSYAPAWALLAQAYAVTPVFNMNIWAGPIEELRPLVQSLLDKAEKAAREAIRLDPRHAGGYGALAYIQTEGGNWVAGDDLFRQALALDSDDPEALNFYSLTLASLGRVKEALSLREQLRTLEPFVPIYNILSAAILQLNGQSEAAIPLLEAIPSGDAVNFIRNIYLAKAYAAAGRYGEAAGTLLAIPANTPSVSRRSVEEAARLLRSAPAKAGAADALPALEVLEFVYAYAGAPNRLMEAPERRLEIGYQNFSLTWAYWEPLNAPVRKTERFKAYVRKAGLVEYWRAKGWPDACHPTTADDFVCS